MEMFEVIIVSAGGVKHHLCGQMTEQEAIDFCNGHDWTWVDENGFEWDLDYRFDAELFYVEEE